MAASAALLAAAGNQHAQEAAHEWPEGSAMHSLKLEAARVEEARPALSKAHTALLDGLGDAAGEPSPLARLVAHQHGKWLAFHEADCDLAGILTGAGSAWPQVHALGCLGGRLEERILALEAAGTCVRGLPQGSTAFEQMECLERLVEDSQPPGAQR